MSFISDLAKKIENENPEKVERQKELIDILNKLFEEQEVAVVTSTVMVAIMDDNPCISALFSSCFVHGLMRYREFMLENGVDVVGIEDGALQE